MFRRRRLYKELGGRSEYYATPLAEILEISLSLQAEDNVQAEREQAQKEEQARQKEDFERKMRQGGRTR